MKFLRIESEGESGGMQLVAPCFRLGFKGLVISLVMNLGRIQLYKIQLTSKSNRDQANLLNQIIQFASYSECQPV